MRKLSMDELNRMSVEDFKHAEKVPVVVVLDNIRSAYNVGSVFRTADAFRIEAIYICGYTARPPHKEIDKTALGAGDSVRWKGFDHAADAVAELQSEGYKVFAIEQVESSISLEQFSVDEQQLVGLVFGNEVSGVQEEVLIKCDGCIEIPQFGMKHSLNISVAAGIVLWEVVRKSISRFMNTQPAR
jgi:23S rRNA (guanosine2251-2'-O)-methyltransferase